MTELEQKMALLAERFAASASAERNALAAALAEEDRQAVRDQAHKLAGVAAMFGHAELGEAAFALETIVETGGDIAQPASLVEEWLRRVAGGD